MLAPTLGCIHKGKVTAKIINKKFVYLKKTYSFAPMKMKMSYKWSWRSLISNAVRTAVV